MQTMTENDFWSIIEDAWHAVDPQDQHRHAFLAGREPLYSSPHFHSVVRAMLRNLDIYLNTLEADTLLAFDRRMEQKLHTIDRADIHQYAQGSDDGFLYIRGFIVAMGRQYYDLVNTKPSHARQGYECERICYIGADLYEEKFGEFPMSPISRETGSNAAGWE
ncbi:MAG: DUF4240 domain-containing protein [Chloroflexota bacterium]|nr:DUF4240 domain-containing protein [Chloroflexota bacterium]